MSLQARYFVFSSTALTLLSVPTAAHAALPEPVKAMIEAAVATGDPQKVETVAELAEQTNPDSAEEVRTMLQQFRYEQALLTAVAEARKEQVIRTAGLFDIWSGKGEIGASRSTGNSHETGLTGALSLERKGLNWRHKLSAAADYHRTDGVTTTEQFMFAYEANYRLDYRTFSFALAQYERDRIQGYSSRISLSAGLGVKFVDRDYMHLSVKAGPAWRGTSLIPSGSESELGVLAALEYDHTFAKNLKFTQVASTYGQSGNSTITSTTGVESKINGNLSARLSYTVEYETDPPDDAIRTDTLSRFTLIYDF